MLILQNVFTPKCKLQNIAYIYSTINFKGADTRHGALRSVHKHYDYYRRRHLNGCAGTQKQH